MVGDKLVGVNVVTKWTSLYSRTSGGVKLSSLSLILSLAGLSTCISSTCSRQCEFPFLIS